MMVGAQPVLFAVALTGILVGAPLAAEPKMSPEAFVNAAAQSDQYEIQSSRLVLSQSRNDEVRAFAQQMIEHHGQTSQALASAAAASKLPPPPAVLGGDQKGMLGALQSLKDADLDKTYISQQVGAHVSALVTQQAYAASGDDPNLRAAAQAAVPVIQHHLDKAKALKAALVDQGG